MRRKRRILYFAHGAEHYLHEAAFSILSLWRLPDGADFDVVVVTDRPAFFAKQLGNRSELHILALDDGLVRLWTRPHGYAHRAKPLAIQWGVRQCCAQPDEAVLFIDSDTVFRCSPSRDLDSIEGGAFAMDAPERPLGDPKTNSGRRLYRATKARQFSICGRMRLIPPETILWNSGLDGFLVKDLEIFDHAIDLIDQIYPLTRTSTIEQAALSIVLAHRAIPICAGGSAAVFHYFMFKEFRFHLAAFFARSEALSPEDRLRLAFDVDADALSRAKLEFLALPRWRRKLLKLSGLTSVYSPSL